MRQSLFTVFEDRQTKLTLTSGQREDIITFRNILGQNHLSLSWDGYIHIRHYVGFISKGNTRLQILPKVYENAGFEAESQQRESMKAMLNLLRISEFNRILEMPNQSSYADKSDIMEVFISIFADKVIHIYSRQMYREYIPISENSAYIKGRIDFTANLRENPIRKDRHVVTFQSFEHDNLINNIIKTVCIKLIRLTVDAENRRKLKKALVFLDDAREVALSKDLFDEAKFTRLNMPFKPAFEMARMFFYSLTPQSYQGDDTVCSFLIPLNQLFEFYLYRLFDAFGDGISTSYQNTRIFARGIDNDFRRTIRPDIILSKSKHPILIADAKYKNPGYHNGIYTNVNQGDIYQVFAYAKVYGVDSVALVYPQFQKKDTPPMVVTLDDQDKKINLIVGCVDIRDADLTVESRKLKQLFRGFI
ncbi:MAG: hypothetical protein GX957_02945 [Clostridiaceae bacterium]|nr:hypothetical protein [Clostridiaceae bacterium]